MRNKRVLFIQHGDTDKPALLGEVLEGLGIPYDVVHPYLDQSVPANLGDYSGLAIGGGAQGVYEQDQYPYLTQECQLVREAMAAERPVIGLCLGGQLMAAALGAEVRKSGRKEIGFFEVTLDPLAQYDPVWSGMPQTFVTTHWHGDVFDVPPGGMKMGSSAMTPNQLFRYGHSMYGMQFHLEMTPEVLEEMIVDSHDYLTDAGVDPDAMRQQGYEQLPKLREAATGVFTRWAALL
jgi:GMP synthase-like glutamine amidotransferase